jgi:hypothetical protein
MANAGSRAEKNCTSVPRRVDSGAGSGSATASSTPVASTQPATTGVTKTPFSDAAVTPSAHARRRALRRPSASTTSLGLRVQTASQAVQGPNGAPARSGVTRGSSNEFTATTSSASVASAGRRSCAPSTRAPERIAYTTRSPSAVSSMATRASGL